MNKPHKRFTKRGLALLLAFALLIGSVPNAVLAVPNSERQEASAVFTNPITQDGIEVWVGDGADEAVKREELAGKPCMTVDPETGVLFLYCNVDDGYLHGRQASVDITVEYLDQGTGKFAIQFDETHTTEIVTLENSGQWKEYTFHVADRDYSNQLNTADFRIGLYAPGMGVSEQKVSFAGLKVKKTEKPVRQEVSAVFTDPITQNGIEAWVGDGANEAVKREELAGKPCMTVQPETEVLFIYCNVDDDYLHGEEANVEITVEYLDQGTGKFAIQFDESHTTETVNLQNSGQWKTHTFLVENQKFSNQLNHSDFRIGLYAPGMGKSEQPVSFAGVKVNKSLTRTDIVSESGKVGFIFANDEPYDLEILSENHSAEEVTTTVAYRVKNGNNNVILEDTAEIVLQANETRKTALPLSDVKGYGVFTLEVELPYGNGQERMVKSFPFSRVLSGGSELIDMMGMGCHFAQGKGDAAKNLALAKQVGAQWVRDEVYWDVAEKEKGVINVPEHWDAWVNKALENQLKPILILDYSNDLYGKDIGSQEWLAGFCNYCKVMAREFRGRCDTFEIWNEWNGGMGLPRPLPVGEYCKVLIAASKAIREENPDAFIIGGVTAGADVSWLKKMVEYPGVYESIDAVSMHPYTYPASPENGGLATSVEKLNGIFGEKPAKEVWLTEIGWPTHIGNTGVSESMAGAYAVRTFAWAMANRDQVSKVFWYDLQNDGMNPEVNEDNFGLLRSWYDEETVPWAAKADYVAVSAFSSKLSGAQFEKQCNLGEGVYAYQFKRGDGSSVVVMWSNGSVNNVTLDVGTDNVALSDMYGNAQGVKPYNGILSVTATDQPVYLEGNFGKDITAVKDGFALLTTDYKVVAGAEFPITIVRSGAFKEMDGTYDVVLPDGFRVRNTDFAAGADQDQIFVHVPEGTPTGSFQITIKPTSGGQALGQFVVNPAVVEPCSVMVNPVYVETSQWSQWQVKATVVNNATTAQMHGRIEILEPEQWAQNHAGEQEFVIEAGGKTDFLFDVPKNPGQELYQVKLRITPDGMDPIVIEKPVGFLGAMEAKQPITVDGVLTPDEWDDTMTFTLGEEDFVTLGGPWDSVSANGYVKWDKDQLYLAIAVEDASHYQAGEGTDIWGGDSVQFCVDPGRNQNPGIIGFNEIGFAKNSKNDKVYSCKWITATKYTDLVNSHFMVKREGNQTVYEAAIPWENLLPEHVRAEAGLNLGFSLLINNNDVNEKGESGRKGFLEYMSGIGIGKEPMQFGDLILVAGDKTPDPQIPSEPTVPETTVPETTVPETTEPAPTDPQETKPGESNPNPVPQTGDNTQVMLLGLLAVTSLAAAVTMVFVIHSRKSKISG